MIKRLVIVSRPIAWVGLSSFFWWGVIASGNSWTPITLIGLLYFVFPGSLLVLGLNDVSDIESDKTNPRKGSTDGAVVSDSEVRTIVISALSTWILFLIILAFEARLYALLSSLLIGVFAYTYSFRPFRLKSRPIIDSCSNGLWITLIFFSGYTINTKGLHLSGLPLSYMLAFFLSFSALHAFATLIDLGADRRAGDRTIGIALGKSRTALAGTILFGLSGLISLHLNIVLVAFYAVCTILALSVYRKPSQSNMVRVKNVFYVGGLIPLPLLYLLLK